MLALTPLQRLLRHYAFAARCLCLLLPSLLLQALPLPFRAFWLIPAVIASAGHTAPARAVGIGMACGCAWDVYTTDVFGIHALLLGALGYAGNRLPHRLWSVLLLTAAGTLLVGWRYTASTLLIMPLVYGAATLLFRQRRSVYAPFTGTALHLRRTVRPVRRAARRSSTR